MALIDRNKQKRIYRPFKREPKILDTVVNQTVENIVQANNLNLGKFIDGFFIPVPVKDTGQIKNFLSYKFEEQRIL